MDFCKNTCEEVSDMSEYQFKNFDSFVETLYRGNEVILEHLGVKYFIEKDGSKPGFYICVGEGCCEEHECSTDTELAQFVIAGEPFSNIFPKMKVLYRNF